MNCLILSFFWPLMWLHLYVDIIFGNFVAFPKKVEAAVKKGIRQSHTNTSILLFYWILIGCLLYY